MHDLFFPARIRKEKPAQLARSCPAHRAWVRSHHCSVPNCRRQPIECAHVRSGTDGGLGIKPSDKWVISLCAFHHRQQHRIGEAAFEAQHGVDLKALACEFARRSKHWVKLGRM
ncbi:hypothetical protein ACUXST_000414 [Sphingomonas sp. F9_3S_D5_B_2]